VRTTIYIYVSKAIYLVYNYTCGLLVAEDIIHQYGILGIFIIEIYNSLIS